MQIQITKRLPFGIHHSLEVANLEATVHGK